MLPGRGCVSLSSCFYELHFVAVVWLQPCRLTAWPLYFAVGNIHMWPLLNRSPSRLSTPHVSSWQYYTEEGVNESLMLLPSITLWSHPQYSRINFAPIIKGSKWASSVLSNFNTNQIYRVFSWNKMHNFCYLPSVNSGIRPIWWALDEPHPKINVSECVFSANRIRNVEM